MQATGTAKRTRVVVTGLGVLAANGIGADAFWKTLRAGRSGVGPGTLFDAPELPCRIAGEVPGFDPKDYLAPTLKARRMGRFTQLGLVAARMALEDSGFPASRLQGTAGVPIVLGVSTSAMDVRGRPAALYSAVTGIPHAAASAIAYAHGIQARLITLSDGCASSLDAISHAAAIVRRGEADFALAGGTDSTIDPYVFTCMSKARKLSVRNDEPHRACRPFDRDRDGGVIAEGAGLVVVESAESAAIRGARVYGEIHAYASHADPDATPEGGGLDLTMQRVLDEGGLRAADIGWVNAHGPGDVDMDRTEVRRIRAVFGPHPVMVSSIKGATGNAMGVGGAHQLIASLLAWREGMIPPTTNLECPDPECGGVDLVFGAPRKVAWNYAMINTHGFGRGNASMIIRRATFP